MNDNFKGVNFVLKVNKCIWEDIKNDILLKIRIFNHKLNVHLIAILFY